jgi:hypothetical protein
MAVKTHNIMETPAANGFIAIVTVYSHWLSKVKEIAFLLSG